MRIIAYQEILPNGEIVDIDDLRLDGITDDDADLAWRKAQDAARSVRD